MKRNWIKDKKRERVDKEEEESERGVRKERMIKGRHG